MQNKVADIRVGDLEIRATLSEERFIQIGRFIVGKLIALPLSQSFSKPS